MSKFYKLTTTYGSYDNFRIIDIGIYSSVELAENAKKEFIEKYKKIIEENPCPIDEETVHKIENGNFQDNEMYNKYTYWRYGKMYNIFEISPEPTIQIINLDETDLNFLNYE